MRNVLILGANGRIARVAIELFLKTTDARLTLYLRDAERLRGLDPGKGSVVSRKSVADLIVELAQSPGLAVRESLGVGRL